MAEQAARCMRCLATCTASKKYTRHMKHACDTHAWAGLSEADGLAEKIAGVIIDA
jgi:uncharacterized C2H2 Zn-finger protein